MEYASMHATLDNAYHLPSRAERLVIGKKNPPQARHRAKQIEEEKQGKPRVMED
jgi:hypothetical protein